MLVNQYYAVWRRKNAVSLVTEMPCSVVVVAGQTVTSDANFISRVHSPETPTEISLNQW